MEILLFNVGDRTRFTNHILYEFIVSLKEMTFKECVSLFLCIGISLNTRVTMVIDSQDQKDSS